MVKTCTVCLSLDVQLFEIGEGELRRYYNLVSGLRTNWSKGFPGYLCYICLAYIRRFKQFREKCQRSHYALQQILKHQKITEDVIKVIDLKQIGIENHLNFMNINNARLEEIKFRWVKLNRTTLVNGDLDILHCSTIKENKLFDITHKPLIEVKVKDEEIIEPCTTIETKQEEHTINNEYTDVLMDFGNDGNDDFETDDHHNQTYESDPNEEEDDDNVSITNQEIETDIKPSDQDVDGMKLDEEYATLVQLSINEAKAVQEVLKATCKGRFKCEICSKSFVTESRLEQHGRIHDKNMSGSFECEICFCTYKTDFLLKMHLTDKHYYKYLCKKCNEVSFDRVSAKQHYVWTHLNHSRTGDWAEGRPNWLSTRGGSRIKGVAKPKTIRTKKPRLHEFRGLQKDYINYQPVSQLEQYQIVLDRKKSRNYLEAPFKCEHCYRGFREKSAFDNHFKKHNPEISGPLQCDMCKIFVKNTRKMYMHMTTKHVFKYSCKMCTFVCYNRNMMLLHYKWHQNVTYSCQYCDKKFMKASTCLTHVRLKHPSTVVCNLCGHSFVSEVGLYCHRRIAHTPEEVEQLTAFIEDPNDPFYCKECAIQFVTQEAFVTHLDTSNKHTSINYVKKDKSAMKVTRARRRSGPGRPGCSQVVNNGLPTSTTCDVCDQVLPNDVQAKKHYETQHPGHEFLKRYMCDVCGHVTKQYANLVAHMRTHTREKPYDCPHCDRKFSLPSNRDRHLVVHTGEKRYQCHHCNRRFTQSSAVKLHIQTVHMKIPYAPWNKAHRKRKAKQNAMREAKMTSIFDTTDPNDICMPPPEHKIVIDNTQGDYLNAYITYNED